MSQNSKINSNIAIDFFQSAEKYNKNIALYFKDKIADLNNWNILSFFELAKIADTYACEFRKADLRRDDKTLVLLKYSPEFLCSVFALFSIGAIPVLIDPGMGIPRLLHCIEKTKPRAMLAIPIVHWTAIFKKSPFSYVKIAFSTDGFLPPFSKIKVLPSWRKIISHDKPDERKIIHAKESDLAAIVFTTGSTGPAKGVEYTHGIFKTQLQMIKKYYDAGEKYKDMPCFPLFAMFSLSLGMPCVIPDIDPSRPAEASPEKIVNIINNHKISFSFASPTLWRNLANYCIKNNIKLKSLKKVLMAGAPVNAKLHSDLKKILPNDAETIVPYGATEALPIANFTGSKMLSDTADLTQKGKGYCVGFPLDECEIRIIKASDEKISHINQTTQLPNFEIGEIIVMGLVVTQHYHDFPEADEFAKIADNNGKFWHRIGDMGYFDDEGKLWFCGRKSHVVSNNNIKIYPAALEAPFNLLFNRRCAIVGLGEKNKETPLLVVEGSFSKQEFNSLKEKIKKLADELNPPLRISHFAFMKKFPVDIRHNAKISREKIREHFKFLESELNL